ncbi:MAG: hypothetical protein WCS17_01855 [Prevotella sp.]
MKTIISIDPGAKGFISIREDDTIDYVSIIEVDRKGLAEIFRELKKKYSDNKNVIVVMEEVHAIYGSSAKATFSFGSTFGFLLGLIMANNFPFALVQPKEWQKEVWVNLDKVYRYGDGKKTIDTKETSIAAAMRIFPNEDLRRSQRCKTIDDNKADSLLIGEYARRRNL